MLHQYHPGSENRENQYHPGSENRENDTNLYRTVMEELTSGSHRVDPT
jgi:hypothetical protein